MMEKWETARIADTGHDAGREYVALLEANSRVAGLQQRIADLEAQIREDNQLIVELGAQLQESAVKIEIANNRIADLERQLACERERGRRLVELADALDALLVAYRLGSGRRGAAASDRVSKSRAALAEPQEGEGSVPAFPPRVYPSDAPNVTGQKRPDLDLDALAKQGEGASE